MNNDSDLPSKQDLGEVMVVSRDEEPEHMDTDILSSPLVVPQEAPSQQKSSRKYSVTDLLRFMNFCQTFI